MTGKDNQSDKAAELRRQAEDKLRSDQDPGGEDISFLSPEAKDSLLHELRVHQIELEMQNLELRRAQKELEAARMRYFDLYDLAPVGYLTVSENGLIREANLTAAVLWGATRGALAGQPFTRFIFNEDQDVYYRRRKELFETGKPQSCELRMMKSDGATFWAGLGAVAAREADGETVCRITMQNIAERRQAEEEQRLVNRILAALNSPHPVINLVRNILLLIKEQTEIEAIGIRLREGEDFPYFQTNGFPHQFVEAERYLCARDQGSEIIRDIHGNPYLECMCGNIICGRTDPSLSFFTQGGSFWTNSTSELLSTTADEDRQTRTRNRCHEEGYESVALIPLRSGDEIIGLLQLNDRRKGRFTLDMIEFFEGIGASIGIALRRQQAAEALRKLNAELEQRVSERTAELTAKTAELEKSFARMQELNRVFVGRELRMAELKERIAELEKKS